MEGRTGFGRLFLPGNQSPGRGGRLLGRYRLPALLLLALVLLIPVFLQSCGGYSIFTVDTKFVPSDITPETLNRWIENGFVDDEGYPVVILDATSSATHIPGAIPVSEATTMTRSDGVVDTIAMVADGATIEALLRRVGIENKLTTVVITGGSISSIARVYFDLRYWGYPQSKLKVLRGTTVVWTGAGFPLVTDIPHPVPSDISVTDLRRKTGLRASLQEMINFAEGSIPDTVAWDVRTPNEYNGVAGSTSGPAAPPGFVAFEGHIKDAVNLDFSTLLVGGNTFLDNDTIIASLAGIGVTKGKTTYVY
jgi:3-mercaptopyruvate sulfurtransferase SseA